MKFDPTKPVQTRGGIPARILCHNLRGAAGGETIIALLSDTNTGQEWVRHYFSDGRYEKSKHMSSEDLVNIPEQTRISGWLNVYNLAGRLSFSSLHLTEEAAKNARASRAIGTIWLDVMMENV